MIAELLLKTVDKLDKPDVTFNSKRCLRSRLNSNTCEICLTHCPKKALMLSDRKIVFNEDRCTGCMTCVSECPNDAFDNSLDISILLHAIQDNNPRNPVVLSCDKSAVHNNYVLIPCIGLLSEPILAALNCVAPNDFYLDVHRCVGCDNGHVLKLLYERIQGIVNKRGNAADLKIRYLAVNDFEEATPGQKRRSFLSMARNSMIELGKDASSVIIPTAKPGIQEQEVEKDAVTISRFLQQALNQFPTDAVQETELLHSYFYTSTTSESCDICPLCTGMCPTGALKRKTDGETKQLSFTSSKCSGCGLCVEFCRKDALQILPGVKTDPAIVQAIA